MRLSNNDIILAEQEIESKRKKYAKENLLAFTRYTMPSFQSTPFHKNYYKILTEFGLGNIKKLIVSCPPQHGKAIDIETPVLTTNGWKNHSDLNTNDFVFGEDGKPKRVLENHGIINIESSMVNLSGGEHIIASNVHEWIVLSDRSKYRKRGVKTERVREILETSRLLENQRRKPAINANIDIKTKKRELPIDPYVLGCWLGDGHSNQGVLTIGKEDILHFGKLGKSREVKNGVYRVLIDGLSKKLRLSNLIKNKHIPINYILSDINSRLELLRGLMDTDGSVDNKGRCEFTQKTGKLSNDIYTLMRSLGLKPTRNTYDMKLYERIVGLKDRIFISKPKYRIFNLERKYNKQQYNGRIDGTRFFIESVEKIGKRNVNCITVDGGAYLVGKQLILTHNSEASSIRLPSWMIGRNPDLKIATISYSATKARKFGRKVKQVMNEPDYKRVFGDLIPDRKSINKINTAEETDIVDHDGFLKNIGYQGGLTGDPVDIMLMDDLYKDWAEANSPTIRENVTDWYVSVADTRLHNDSQQLIVFTRWHEDDLVGFIEKNEKVVTIESFEDIEEHKYEDCWFKINFEAIKTGSPTEIDKREKDEPLWASRHSYDKLMSSKSKDPVKFDALYQGNPTSSHGILYNGFQTYTNLPSNITVRRNYTDTADTGDDYLCSVVYDETSDGKAYLIDVLYTQEPMEVTEPLTANLLKKNNVRQVDIESNNGGRGFARKIDELTPNTCSIRWFHQSQNKEARIISNSATVMERLIMPDNWHVMFPEFFNHLTRYKRAFKANAHDDAPDTITGIIECIGKGTIKRKPSTGMW